VIALLNAVQIMRRSRRQGWDEGLRRGTSDLLITDPITPEREGIETMRRLREDFPEMKIILISEAGRIGLEEYLHFAKIIGHSAH